jgi:hypothetical protein
VSTINYLSFRITTRISIVNTAYSIFPSLIMFAGRRSLGGRANLSVGCAGMGISVVRVGAVLCWSVGVHRCLYELHGMRCPKCRASGGDSMPRAV